jgi:hypothetical protein
MSSREDDGGRDGRVAPRRWLERFPGVRGYADEAGRVV